MKRIVAGILLAALSVPAFAQTPPPPVRVRGTVEKFENLVLTVQTREGGTTRIKLADNYAVVGVGPAKIDDIAKGKYIGTATLGQRNGELIALEVHIFAESFRGLGEGHYPWDLRPGTLMTNANVTKVVATKKDRTLTVQYKGGEKTIYVPLDADIVSFEPTDRGELKVGVHIFCVAQKAPDGSLTAARVNVGLKGITPPM